MTWHLQNQGHGVNEKCIRRLMRLMGLRPIYQTPNTSRPAKGHKTYPYLLRDLQVCRPNQVWCADITYLPMRRGFLYLVAVMDWQIRKVLAWRLSNTLEADFCVEALTESIHRFGPPEIMNMEHGRATGPSGHATPGVAVHVLRLDQPPKADRRAHLDGWQGRCIDNVLIERLWRSLKYECVYLHAWEAASQAKAGVARWMTCLTTTNDPTRPMAEPRPPRSKSRKPTRLAGPASSLETARPCPTKGEQLSSSMTEDCMGALFDSVDNDVGRGRASPLPLGKQERSSCRSVWPQAKVADDAAGCGDQEGLYE